MRDTAQVTDCLRSSFRFRCVRIDDREERNRLEALLVATSPVSDLSIVACLARPTRIQRNRAIVRPLEQRLRRRSVPRRNGSAAARSARRRKPCPRWQRGPLRNTPHHPVLSEQARPRPPRPAGTCRYRLCWRAPASASRSVGLPAGGSEESRTEHSPASQCFCTDPLVPERRRTGRRVPRSAALGAMGGAVPRPGRPATHQTFDAKADARAWLASVETDMQRGAFIDPALGRITYAEWCGEYFAGADRQGPRRSPVTAP